MEFVFLGIRLCLVVILGHNWSAVVFIEVWQVLFGLVDMMLTHDDDGDGLCHCLRPWVDT